MKKKKKRSFQVCLELGPARFQCASSVFHQGGRPTFCSLTRRVFLFCFVPCRFLRRRSKSLEMIDDEVRLRSDACRPYLLGVLCLFLSVQVPVPFFFASSSSHTCILHAFHSLAAVAQLNSGGSFRKVLFTASFFLPLSMFRFWRRDSSPSSTRCRT